MSKTKSKIPPLTVLYKRKKNLMVQKESGVDCSSCQNFTHKEAVNFTSDIFGKTLVSSDQRWTDLMQSEVENQETKREDQVQVDYGPYK